MENDTGTNCNNCIGSFWIIHNGIFGNIQKVINRNIPRDTGNIQNGSVT